MSGLTGDTATSGSTNVSASDPGRTGTSWLAIWPTCNTDGGPFTDARAGTAPITSTVGITARASTPFRARTPRNRADRTSGAEVCVVTMASRSHEVVGAQSASADRHRNPRIHRTPGSSRTTFVRPACGGSSRTTCSPSARAGPGSASRTSHCRRRSRPGWRAGRSRAARPSYRARA